MREQLISYILTDMDAYLGANEKAILKGVLVNRLKDLEITSNTQLATLDDSNEEFIKMFIALKGTRLSQRSMQEYLRTLKQFIELVNKPLNKTTAIDIEYFLHIKAKTNSETSLNNYRRNLSAFFTWMRKKRFMDYNPCEEVEAFKEVKKPIDHLEVTELETIKGGCRNTRDRALIEFLRCTAVRVGELVTVRVKDIDFTTGKIVVYGHKSKKYRCVYLDKIALGYIRKMLFERGTQYDSDEYLFCSSRDKSQISESAIRKQLNCIKDNAHISRRIYPHLFRKDCATRIIRRGGTVEDAGEYLGHAEQSVTGRNYAYKDESHVEQIFEKYVATV